MVLSDNDRKKGLASKKIHADMAASLGDNVPALSTVKKWAAKFKRGRESLKDVPRSGRPSTVTTKKDINRTNQMMMDDKHLTVNHFANVISISCERGENILCK